MPEIRPLRDLNNQLLERLITGYASTEAFQVVRDESPDLIRFELRLIQRAQPFVKCYPPPDAATRERYRALATAGHAFGAFDDEQCVGLALIEPYTWNTSLHIHEFHIVPAYHRRGMGRALMAAVEAHARDTEMRRLVCETQTTNVPAIRFYRALGFTVDAVDVSLYSNDDLERGEMALFMKKRLA
jgi:ribosomal protein S18 acetylase RimI-like enzyme